MATGLTEEQIAEFREAFNLFEDTACVRCEGLVGRPVIPVAAGDVPVSTAPLPLVEVNGKVNAFVATGSAFIEMRLEYIFRNQESTSLECTFYAPKPPGAAVTGCDVTIRSEDGVPPRFIRGVVQPKDEALGLYDKAVTRGKNAVLIEHQADDSFYLAVGQLRPGAMAAVRVTFGLELPVDMETPSTGSVRLQVPCLVDTNRYALALSEQGPSEEFVTVDARACEVPFTLCSSWSSGDRLRITGVESPTHDCTTPTFSEMGHMLTATSALPPGAQLGSGAAVFRVQVGGQSDGADGKSWSSSVSRGGEQSERVERRESLTLPHTHTEGLVGSRCRRRSRSDPSESSRSRASILFLFSPPLRHGLGLCPGPLRLNEWCPNPQGSRDSSAISSQPSGGVSTRHCRLRIQVRESLSGRPGDSE